MYEICVELIIKFFGIMDNLDKDWGYYLFVFILQIYINLSLVLWKVGMGWYNIVFYSIRYGSGQRWEYVCGLVYIVFEFKMIRILKLEFRKYLLILN